jgi:hypothetical protein
MFEDFKVVEVRGLCPSETKEQSLKRAAGVRLPAAVAPQKGAAGLLSMSFGRCTANAEDPPPAQPLALEAPPAAAGLPAAAARPAASLGDFSHGGQESGQRCPPPPAAGGRRPIVQQASRLRGRAAFKHPPRATPWAQVGRARLFFRRPSRCCWPPQAFSSRPAARLRQRAPPSHRRTAGRRAARPWALPAACRRPCAVQRCAAASRARATAGSRSAWWRSRRRRWRRYGAWRGGWETSAGPSRWARGSGARSAASRGSRRAGARLCTSDSGRGLPRGGRRPPPVPSAGVLRWQRQLGSPWPPPAPPPQLPACEPSLRPSHLRLRRRRGCLRLLPPAHWVQTTRGPHKRAPAPRLARTCTPARCGAGRQGGGGGQAKELAKEGGQLPKRRLAMSRVESGGSGGSGR